MAVHQLHMNQGDVPEAPAAGPTGRTNPLRMLLLGLLSMLLGIGATPAVLCVLYPLVTTAEFGDSIPTDSGGVFVVAATLFVAVYKLLDAGWVWLTERCQTLLVRCIWMLVGVFALGSAIWPVLLRCDDSQTDSVEASAVVESNDDCYTDTDDAAPLPRDTNRYAVALLSDTANAGDRDKYNHCRYLSVLNPSQDAPQQP